MNQILLTDEQNNKRKKNKDNAIDIKKIIIFFGIVIIIFGISIAGVYGYNIYKNNKKEEKTISKPQVSLENTESEIKIIAKAEAGINKIIYIWNDDEPNEIEMNGRVTHEEIMEIPVGKNTLKVKVVDQNGQEIETSGDFTKQNNSSNGKITIETSVMQTGKLKIIASSEEPMKDITYRWNDEDSVTVNAENETDTTIETTIDVKRGKNKLTVIATDTSDNMETITNNFTGVNNPIIEVTKNGNQLYMKISHDMGFEKIEFSVNGTIYKYDEEFSGYDSAKKDIEYKFDLKNGENTVIIMAVSMEGTQATYKGKCNYTAE